MVSQWRLTASKNCQNEVLLESVGLGVSMPHSLPKLAVLRKIL